MAKIIFVVISMFFLLIENSNSQNSKWENFTDYKNVTALAADTASDKIYCASKGGMFVVEMSTGKVLTKYENLNGLVNNDLTSLALDNNNRLWVGASDGSISILNLQNSTWKYIFDIKNSTETNKIINFLYLSGNFMFAATGYGIQKISTSSFNFIDAPYYKLGSFPNNTIVYALTSNNNIIYAATKSGVAYANMLTSNLNNPASWLNYNGSNLNADVRTIETYDNKIFAGSLTGFSYYDGFNWMLYPNPLVSGQNTKFIKTIGNNLYFISGDFVYNSNQSNLSNITPFLNSDNYSVISYDINLNPILGLAEKGVILISSGYDNFLFPNGPYTNSFNHIIIDNNNNIWAAGGTGNSGIYKFDGKVWEDYNTTTHPEIGNSNTFSKVTYGNGIVWALSFGGGPTLIQGNNIQNFNTSNSNLPGIPGPNGENFTACSGGAYDLNGVFWLSLFNSNSGRFLYAYTGSNQWTGFILGSNQLTEIAVDSYNTKWIVSGSVQAAGVYFFNENGSLTNPSDDILGFYNNADFGPEITNITDVIVDKNNEVWISTNNGIFIINNPYAAIQNPLQKPRPQKLGIISGNLKVPFTENCITITNDILNDKWVGTETNGVFHLSDDGSTLIQQLNTAKTPILANKIPTIAVSNVTGKAFFGTQRGLSSYITDAIKPVQDFDQIIASPNPYLVPSDVSLKIDGLVENSIIKIITLNGEIINEFDTPGGRIAFWDGKNNINNQYASTGIYIIVAYNSDGSKVGTGKVAVVNK